MEVHLKRVIGGNEESLDFCSLIGRSVAMQDIFALISKLSRSAATVLVTGESGTGKELVARAIHSLSPRATAPFVAVNCAAIPEELLESELFGHVRGAFTGAISSRQGRFQLANGGTLLLDEIGEMSPRLQVKLLRVLQEREFEPLGSDKAVRVDVRIVAATNRDLRTAVKEGRFREDLYYRLNVLPIKLPPLRERGHDVSLLAAQFIRLHAAKKGKVVEKIEEEALDLLERYRWPGNVRELENLMERLVILKEDDVIRARDLPDHISHVAPDTGELSPSFQLPKEGVDLDSLLQRIENVFIVQALSRTRGNKTLAADLLRLKRTTLIERLRKRNLIEPAFEISMPLVSVRNLTPANLSLTGDH